MLTFPTRKKKWRFHLLAISILCAGMSFTVMHETPTGNRWLKSVIEHATCYGCESVKRELQPDPPRESIRKPGGDPAWSNHVSIWCLDNRSLILNRVVSSAEKMAVFPPLMFWTRKKQERTNLHLEKQTSPGGWDCSYANWTLVGKSMMTHTRDWFHKDGCLLSTSLEMLVFWLSFLCCFLLILQHNKSSNFPQILQNAP